MKAKIFVTILLSFLITTNSFAAEIISSIKPIDSLVKGVVGNTAQTLIIIDKNQSSHGFSLKPSQIKTLEKAKIIFYVDDSFETFLPKVFATIPDQIRKIALSQRGNLKLYKHREGVNFEAHNHGDEEVEESGKNQHHHDHDHSHLDMHIWLSPKNAIELTKVIVQELSKINPQNKTIYKNNAQKQISKLQALDKEIKAELKNLPNRKFIAFHDAYQYFERAYGLETIASITIEPHLAPSAKRIKEVRERIAKSGVSCVLAEPQFNSDLVNLVTKNTKVKIGVLDEIGLNIESNEDLYFQLMRKITKDIKNCLE